MMVGVMKSLTRMFQAHLRAQSRPQRRPVYQQLEFPFHGIRLRPEEWRTVCELSRLRQQIAVGEL